MKASTKIVKAYLKEQYQPFEGYGVTVQPVFIQGNVKSNDLMSFTKYINGVRFRIRSYTPDYKTKTHLITYQIL